MGATCACRGERGRYTRTSRQVLALATAASLAMACASAPDRFEVDPVAWGYPEHQYVIDRIVFPTYHEPVAFEFDLDYDGKTENALGECLMTLKALGALTCGLQPSADAFIQQGAVVAMLSVFATAMQDSPSANVWAFVVEPHANPPAAGAGPTVDTTAAAAFLGGRLEGGAGRFGGPAGALVVDLPLCGSLVRVPLTAARIHFEVSPDGAELANGRLGGLMDESAARWELAPVLGDLLARDLAANCAVTTSGCSCASGTSAESLQSWMDTNYDCTIDADEVRNNSLTRRCFTPDVALPDGTKGVSVALGFSAKATTFMHPTLP